MMQKGDVFWLLIRGSFEINFLGNTDDGPIHLFSRGSARTTMTVWYMEYWGERFGRPAFNDRGLTCLGDNIMDDLYANKDRALVKIVEAKLAGFTIKETHALRELINENDA